MTGTSQKTPNIHVEREEFPFWDPPYKWRFLSYEFDCSVLDNCLYSMICIILYVWLFMYYSLIMITLILNAIKGISGTDVKCTLHRTNRNTKVIAIIHWPRYCPWQFTDSAEYSTYLHQTILGYHGPWQTWVFYTCWKQVVLHYVVNFSWTFKVDFL